MANAYPTTRDRLRAILTDDINVGRQDYDLETDTAIYRYHDMRVGRFLDAAERCGFDDFESIEDELDFAELEEELAAEAGSD